MLGDPIVVLVREPVGERLAQGGEADRVIDPGLLVEDAELDRAEIGMRAHVLPQR